MGNDAPIRPLTKRQEEVARLVGQGLSYKAIGARLHISRHTARAHVQAIALLLPQSDAPAYRQVQVWAFWTFRTSPEGHPTARAA